MLRIVDGFCYEGKPSADRFVVTLHDLGNGHREACVQRAVDWVESGPTHCLDAAGNLVGPAEPTDDELEEKRDANRRRAARRAKTMCRRLCKTLGCDSLLTLTYRQNVLDLAVMKRHFKEFVRRLKRVIGKWVDHVDADGVVEKRWLSSFVYVAAFERQKRGAWHCHIATNKLPRDLPARNGVKVKSFNIVRAIWRSVSQECGGNIDSQNAKPWHSPARLAAYLSKYMLKAFEEGDDWSNRYSGTQLGAARPKPTRMEFQAAAMGDLMDLVYAEVCVGDCDTFSWFSRFGDTFYIATEPELRQFPGWA